jgi:hypothetical protein
MLNRRLRRPARGSIPWLRPNRLFRQKATAPITCEFSGRQPMEKQCGSGCSRFVAMANGRASFYRLTRVRMFSLATRQMRLRFPQWIASATPVRPQPWLCGSSFSKSNGVATKGARTAESARSQPDANNRRTQRSALRENLRRNATMLGDSASVHVAHPNAGVGEPGLQKPLDSGCRPRAHTRRSRHLKRPVIFAGQPVVLEGLQAKFCLRPARAGKIGFVFRFHDDMMRTCRRLNIGTW